MSMGMGRNFNEGSAETAYDLTSSRKLIGEFNEIYRKITNTLGRPGDEHYNPEVAGSVEKADDLYHAALEEIRDTDGNKSNAEAELREALGMLVNIEQMN